MIVKLFGKSICGKCLSTKNKIQFFLKKFDLESKVEFQYFDLHTAEGLAEALVYGVTENIPMLIFESCNNTIARYDGVVITTEELKKILQNET